MSFILNAQIVLPAKLRNFSKSECSFVAPKSSLLKNVYVRFFTCIYYFSIYCVHTIVRICLQDRAGATTDTYRTSGMFSLFHDAREKVAFSYMKSHVRYLAIY